jgi:hypothetical protein
MKTCNLSVATVVLGALAISYSACSAQGIDNTLPGGSNAPLAGSSSGQTAGTSNGTGGSGPITGSGGLVTHPGAAGSAPAAAGGSKFNTGVGGATTSSGGHGSVGTAGSATGSGGSGTTTGGCKAAVGLATELLIDDMEDGDHVIRPIGARIGYWFTYNDGTAVQMPSGATFVQTAGVGASATSTKFAETSGPAFMTWGGGIGFDFNNSSAKSCAYDASAYAGIKFWAKGNVAIRATVKIPGTTAKKTNGADAGTCVATTTAMCDDHYGLTTATLTTAWKEFTLDFAATTFAQEGWGTKVAFDSKNIIAMQFQVAKALPFDFSIDDVTFYTK